MEQYILESWVKKFPELTLIKIEGGIKDVTIVHRDLLIKRLGPLLIGYNFDKFRSIYPSYEACFTAYSLWQSSLNECFSPSANFVMTAVKDSRGEDWVLPLREPEKSIEQAGALARNQALFPMQGDIKLDRVLDTLTQYADKSIRPLMGNAACARIWEAKLCIALYVNDVERAEHILAGIKEESKMWSEERMNTYHGGLENWLNLLQQKIDERDKLMQLINDKAADKMLAGLNVSEIIK